ncbi:tRNA glutamyl-Q(34) synthetase GluQRS [Salinicola sp. MH3R3-1]|uniref:tRNA glutamyl-Q(34) synthetase GluQRS n=1 Tax=Salinicola sp. MH3R3-1 TaxID=1928762 RepID=UPI00094F26DF|nr:tRNA glutamyl-Q(34) synthetase GluQRS [Salinicola sp. MH3R3-1]OLO08328.1 tRNA glutamyl-Q(34) synthetase GluQRS [Salinicola sp. MH3R3-1]
MTVPLASTPNYIGRFAPTPSGPLHMGSLVAAVGSWLDARAVGGRWLLRIEDIDPPRCPPGAADQIQRQLEAFGLTWDGEIRYQSERNDAYQAALDRLIAAGMAYPCGCSRREWQHEGYYPGWCRQGSRHPARAQAWRLRTDRGIQPVTWQDRLFGHQCLDPTRQGDVVIKRKEGLWAYQLAVVVDDADQNVTDIVRGFDLLDNTPWQRQLQVALGYPEPRYLHLPLILGDDGQKLSKQNLATAIPDDGDVARPLLHQALQLLDQRPPRTLRLAPVADQLAHACRNWSPDSMSATSGRAQD